MDQTQKLAQGQEEWEEEQGGLGFLREVSLVSAAVATKAAEWGNLVAAEVAHLLVRQSRVDAARRQAKRQLFRRIYSLHKLTVRAHTGCAETGGFSGANTTGF